MLLSKESKCKVTAQMLRFGFYNAKVFTALCSKQSALSFADSSVNTRTREFCRHEGLAPTRMQYPHCTARPRRALQPVLVVEGREREGDDHARLQLG